MNTITRHLALLALVLVATATAPAQNGPAARLEAARLATEVEGDHAAAVRLYAGVRQDEEARVEQREQATYEGALLARKLGRHDEATALFESIADGESDWAKKARLALEGGPEATDPRTAQRIFSAIAKLSNESTAPGGATELGLIGGTAVPYLAQAIRREYNDLSFTTRAVHSLIDIGGDGPAAFFREVAQSDDDIFRRTVAHAITSATKPDARVEPMLTEVRRFLSDEDAEIRRWMISHLKSKLTVEERIRGLRDPELEVVRALVKESRHVDVTPDDVTPYCDAIDSALERHPSLTEELILISCATSILETGSGLRHFLDFLERFDELSAQSSLWQKCGRNWYSHFRKMSAEERPSLRDFIDRVPRLTEQLRSCRVVKARDSNDWRGVTFASILQGYVKTCGREEFADLLDLVTALSPFSMDDDIDKHVIRMFEPGDAPAVLPRLEDFRSAYKVADWLRENTEPEPWMVAHVRRWFAQRLKDGRNDGLRWQSVGTMIGYAVAFRDEGLVQQIVDLTQADPNNLFRVAVEALLSVEARGAAVVKLLGLEGSAMSRSSLIHALVLAGDREAIDAIIGVYERGDRLEPSQVPGQTLPRWDQWGYAEADALRLLDGVLATGSERAWGLQHDWRLMDEDARRVFVRHMKVCEAETTNFATTVRRIMPDLIVMATSDDELKNLCEYLLTHPDEKVRLEATNRLHDAVSPHMESWVLRAMADPAEAVAAAAITAAGVHRIEAAIPLVEEFLDRSPQSPWVMDALVRLAGDRALERLTTLLASPNASVRLSACRRLGRLTTRDAIPPLIAALRDANESVRDRAQESLESLQFYFDQKSRWDAWSRGAGLDGASAAEALVAQARSEDKAIRLVAIASLGTLKEPTTLPFLIKLMTEDDADIAAAAKAAVAKINAAKSD